jgi:hypothetical protein
LNGVVHFRIAHAPTLPVPLQSSHRTLPSPGS